MKTATVDVQQQPVVTLNSERLNGSTTDQQAKSLNETVTPVTPEKEVAYHWPGLLQLRRDGPCRPPNWRSRLAEAIANHADVRVAERLREWGDEWVERLLQVRGHVLEPHHPLAQARDVLVQVEPRIELEGRLLAGQSSHEIAKATGMKGDTVEWYHAAYFDCRDRLNAGGFVIHNLLGSCLPVGTGTSPPFALLPWYGYFFGPYAIDLLLEVFRFWEADRKPMQGMTAAKLTQRARRLTARASIEARMLPIETLGHADLRTLIKLAERGNRNQVIR